jgi:hypothetical protein
MKSARPLVLLSLLAACSGDDGGDDGGDGNPGGPAYLVSSLVSAADDTSLYVSVLPDLGAQELDYERAREFAGGADLWVHGGAVFVADGESLTVTRYTVEGDVLVPGAAISFQSYGLTDVGFWNNIFVADDKAYMLHGADEYVVWNPATMEITGTIALPTFPDREGFQRFPGYADRAAVVRDGRVYQPLYWTDETFFLYTEDTPIAVIDVATDRVIDTITAPCPGLDYATVDAAGDIYFSSWVYAPGGAAVLDQPDTCVFRIPTTGEPGVAFRFADVTGGRQGAAFRFLPDGNAMFSTFHHERFTIDETTDVAAVTFGPNWKFWHYDRAAGTATQLDTFDWNAGAVYAYDIDGHTYMLVAAGDYSATTIYDLGTDGRAATPLFDTQGWALRLFRAR